MSWNIVGVVAVIAAAFVLVIFGIAGCAEKVELEKTKQVTACLESGKTYIDEYRDMCIDVDQEFISEGAVIRR